MSKTILYLSKGEHASSTRYRALQYFPLLKQAHYKPKHHTISGGLLSFLTALNLARQVDIVVLIRKTYPAPLLWLLRTCSKKLVFDFDDAIFCRSNGSNSDTKMSRFIRTIRACDYVFAGNRYLAETAQQYQRNTAVVPTALDTQKYTLKRTRHDQQFVLVWIGSQSTKKYIADILPAIEKAAQTIPNLQLKIIADFDLNSDHLSIQNIAWTEEREAIEIKNADVGLAPLPADNWTRGKCALKVLQYMSASLPVITSPTGANADVIEASKSGYFANDNQAWSDTILTAYHHKGQQLATMGNNGFLRVSKTYDINVVFKQIDTYLTTLSSE